MENNIKQAIADELENPSRLDEVIRMYDIVKAKGYEPQYGDIEYLFYDVHNNRTAKRFSDDDVWQTLREHYE